MISKHAANQITTRGVCVYMSRKSMSDQNLRDGPDQVTTLSKKKIKRNKSCIFKLSFKKI